jgi:diadenosine tetraphosphate (Ap4A) HIT family hydrolase
MASTCIMCQRIAQHDSNPHFIYEFANSLLLVGDHQFHRGYCILVLKDHTREMHELPPEVARAVMDELMAGTRAVVKTFSPWKINHACYGNVVPHIHWHIFPRYQSDPDHLNHPWLHASKFNEHQIAPEAAGAIAKQIRANL